MNEKVAVCIPTYRASGLLSDTMRYLSKQTFQNFTIYIRDDTPTTDGFERNQIAELVESYSDTRIRFAQNEENIGYPRNLMRLINDTEEDLVFLLAQDDVLSDIAIESCVRAFETFSSLAAVSRPYFWFFDDLKKPVRVIKKLGNTEPLLIHSQSEIEVIIHALVASSQLTGLMYRKSRLTEDFVDSVFPAHIYPVAGAIRDGALAFLPFHTVAVSIEHSQTRSVSSIYEESPAKAWVELYEKVFAASEMSHIRNAGIKQHMGKNFVGLIQIRSYGKYRYFWREVAYMIRLRPSNLVDPRFLFTITGLGVLPRTVTRRLTDFYKTTINSRRLTNERLAVQEDSWI